MKRYFLHSFPRLRRGETRDRQLAKGLMIAESLLKNGLLLTPETYDIPITAGNGMVIDRLKVTQRRICFTELEPEALPAHAETFGPFAVAYNIDTLRQLGALPVFYVPLQTQGGYLSGLATEIVGGLTDSFRLVQSLVAIRRHLSQSPSIKIDYRGRSVDYSPDASDVIRSFIDTLMDSARADLGVTDSRLRSAASLFYPTEHPRYTEALHYYRQREWRILGGAFTFNGQEPIHKATPEQVETLLAIDSDFFSRPLSFPNDRAGVGAEERDTLGRRSHFFQNLGDLDVVGAAAFLVYPDGCEIPSSIKDGFAARGVQVVSQSTLPAAESPPNGLGGAA